MVNARYLLLVKNGLLEPLENTKLDLKDFDE